MKQSTYNKIFKQWKRRKKWFSHNHSYRAITKAYERNGGYDKIRKCATAEQDNWISTEYTRGVKMERYKTQMKMANKAMGYKNDDKHW